MPIKNKRKLHFLFLALVMALALFACGDEEHMRDLSAYVDAVKKAITKHQRTDIIAGIQLPTPVIFQSTGKERDPFEEEVATYSGGSMNNPMTAFPVKQFEFLGLIRRENKTWAIIKAPDNKIYQLTINDRIGDHYGRIIEIYSDHIKVEESIPQQEAGESGPEYIKRIVTLQMKGEN